MPLSSGQSAAVGRLGNFYDGDNPYNAQTNPGGFQQGGHRINFPLALKDVASAAQGVASLVSDAASSASSAAGAAQTAANYATTNPKALVLSGPQAFTSTEILQGLANLGLLSSYLSMSSAQQAAFRLNLGAASNDDLRAIARSTAKAVGVPIQTGNLMIEEFRDTSGMDPSSTGGLFDTANGILSNQGVETTTSLPPMTSNSTPAGYVAGSNVGSLNGSALYDPWHAFAQDGGGTSWCSINTYSGPWVLQLNLPSLMMFGAYQILPNNQGLQDPLVYSLQGSVAGGAWETIDTQTGGIGGGAKRTIASPKAYDSHRLYITSSNGAGAHCCVGEVIFYKQVSGAMDYKTIVCPCQTVPNKASLFLAAKAVSGTLNINTNLIAKVTRGGGQYLPFTLQQFNTIAGWSLFKQDGLDLSTLPQGTSPALELIVPASVSLQFDTFEFGYGA